MAMEASLQRTESATSMQQLDRIMQPDSLLPAQYFQARRKPTPEHRLMIAVLFEALHCLEKHRFATTLEDRRLFREAQDWFLADERNWPYSFECMCAVLDLEVDAVRERLGVLLEREARPRPLPAARRAPRAKKWTAESEKTVEQHGDS